MLDTTALRSDAERLRAQLQQRRRTPRRREEPHGPNALARPPPPPTRRTRAPSRASAVGAACASRTAARPDSAAEPASPAARRTAGARRSACAPCADTRSVGRVPRLVRARCVHEVDPMTGQHESHRDVQIVEDQARRQRRPQRAPHRVDRARHADRGVHVRFARGAASARATSRDRSGSAGAREPPPARAVPTRRRRPAAPRPARAAPPHRGRIAGRCRRTPARRRAPRARRRSVPPPCRPARRPRTIRTRARRRRSTSAAAPSCARRTPPRRRAVRGILALQQVVHALAHRDRVGTRRDDRRHARQRRRARARRIGITPHQHGCEHPDRRGVQRPHGDDAEREASAASVSISPLRSARRWDRVVSRDLRRHARRGARPSRCRVRAEPVPRAAQPLLEADLHLVAEQPLRALQPGQRIAHVAGARRHRLAHEGAAGDVADQRRELLQRRALPAPTFTG